MKSTELTDIQKKQLARIAYTIEFVVLEFEKLAEIMPSLYIAGSKLAFLEALSEEFGFDMQAVRKD